MTSPEEYQKIRRQLQPQRVKLTSRREVEPLPPMPPPSEHVALRPPYPVIIPELLDWIPALPGLPVIDRLLRLQARVVTDSQLQLQEGSRYANSLITHVDFASVRALVTRRVATGRRNRYAIANMERALTEALEALDAEVGFDPATWLIAQFADHDEALCGVLAAAANAHAAALRSADRVPSRIRQQDVRTVMVMTAQVLQRSNYTAGFPVVPWMWAAITRSLAIRYPYRVEPAHDTPHKPAPILDPASS